MFIFWQNHESYVQIEALGSSGGTPSKQVVITDSRVTEVFCDPLPFFEEHFLITFPQNGAALQG